MYSLRFDPLGFLPVPFLGSFFFFLPSDKLLLIMLNTSTLSSSFNSLGKKGINFSIEILAAFLAAVPDTFPCVTVTANAKLSYLSTLLVLLAISEKSSSSPSLAPIIHNTLVSG